MSARPTAASDAPRRSEVVRWRRDRLAAAGFADALAADLAGSQPGELEDLATQAAADALMAIMRKLHTFRGDSRFTTWAYKFALLEAAVKVRTRTWQEREVPLEDDGWAQLADRRAAPDTDAETAELIDAVRRAIAETLTPHQRTALIAIT